MRRIIQRHNRLNGIWFSTLEFGLIALFGGAFAIYYLVHHRVVMSLITWGIALNCVPVVVYGIRSLLHRGEMGEHIASFWDKTAREQHLRENPNMLSDTLVLTVATLLPFVSLAAVLFDIFSVSEP